MTTAASSAGEGRRLILVVGASSDIGGAVIRLADSPTTTFVGQYRRSKDKLEALTEGLAGRLVGIRADLAREDEVARLSDAVGEIGVPDGIVFLAAPSAVAERFHKKTWNSFQEHIDVQLRGPTQLLRALLPAMAKRKRGRVVFVSSSYTLGVPPMGLSDYVTVKHAVNGLVKALAAEYGAKGLCVNAVSPSMVETAFLARVPRIVVEMSADSNPLKRNATPDDVAPLVHFLLSPQASYLNGVNVPVTAGCAM